MEVKSIFTSVTFWGALITMCAALFPTIFVAIGLDPNSSAIYAQKIVAGIGTAIAIWGRLRARQVATVTGAPPKDGAVALEGARRPPR